MNNEPLLRASYRETEYPAPSQRPFHCQLQGLFTNDDNDLFMYVTRVLLMLVGVRVGGARPDSPPPPHTKIV